MPDTETGYEKMKKGFLLFVLMAFFMIVKVSAQFADPWYNWYYNQQMQLNQQMMYMQMMQHQITEYHRQQAENATRQLMTNPTGVMTPPVPRSNSDRSTSRSITGSEKNKSSNSNSRFCSTCSGNGKCYCCHGSGMRTDNYYGTGTSTQVKCGVCGGNGKCSSCGGSGRR